MAGRAGITFNLDVTLNRQHAITNIFAGELFASHAAGWRFAHQTAMVGVEAPYDVVVTTNSGWPLDQNLYQSVKGLSAAAQIVRQGGTIVLASECADGLPEHGRYGGLLRRGRWTRGVPARARPAGYGRPRSVAGPGPGPDSAQGARARQGRRGHP